MSELVMAFVIVLVVVVPALIGSLLVALAWPRATRHDVDRLAGGGLRLALGFGIGIGVTSILTFGARAVASGWPMLLGVVEMLLLGGLFFLHRNRRSLPEPPPGSASTGAATMGLYAGLALATTGFALAGSVLAVRTPHGGWDATAIWNLRARFLYRSGADWAERTFAPELWWSHPDYPLLLPLSVGRGWGLTGEETTWVPTLLAAAFTLSTLLLLVCTVSVLATRRHGAVAGLLLVGTPLFLFHGLAQYADVAVAFYLLSAIVLTCLALRQIPSTAPRLWLLVGLTASLAAWTKNEGIAALVVILLVGIGLAFRRSGRAGWRAAAAFSAGAAPILLVLVYFKSTLAAPNDLVSAALRGQLAQFVSWERHQTILEAFVAGALRFGEWAIHPAWVVAPLALVLGPVVRKRGLEVAAVSLSLFGLLSAYYLAYLVSPYDLGWHIGSSLARLFLQLWPATLLLLCLAIDSRSAFRSLACSSPPRSYRSHHSLGPDGLRRGRGRRPPGNRVSALGRPANGSGQLEVLSSRADAGGHRSDSEAIADGADELAGWNQLVTGGVQTERIREAAVHPRLVEDVGGSQRKRERGVCRPEVERQADRMVRRNPIDGRVVEDPILVLAPVEVLEAGPQERPVTK